MTSDSVVGDRGSLASSLFKGKTTEDVEWDSLLIIIVTSADESRLLIHKCVWIADQIMICAGVELFEFVLCAQMC